MLSSHLAPVKFHTCLFEQTTSKKAVLQIRRGTRAILGLISHISIQNHICDPSLEPSHGDGSN